ncbi:MAG TPA: gliding motility lipoprotein GldD [Paludibacter sp.]|nr:gliding motility lipoprotein GldD [Paludibacter sp.]
MKAFRFFVIYLVAGISVLLVSCGRSSIPRPYGYFRVDLPEHTYRTIDTLSLPYRFDLPKNAKLVSRNAVGEKFWIDIYYPKLNASIYCSYKPVNGNLIELLEDTRKIVYKHSVRADGIGEKVFDHPEKNVHGILYDLKGNTASSVQFILTDSTKHFFRAALYFNNVPNKDSIAPMSNYIREDIVRIMESFEWKK